MLSRKSETKCGAKLAEQIPFKGTQRKDMTSTEYLTVTEGSNFKNNHVITTSHDTNAGLINCMHLLQNQANDNW
jgi:hypothetical protein